jgi:ABC-type transport system substrate-binding protein
LKNLNIFFSIILFFLPAIPGIYSQTSGSFGDQLVIGVVDLPPPFLNPYQINSLIERQLVRLVFGSGLYQQEDRFGQPPFIIEERPAFANPREQGIKWHFILKRNINFQNGIPLRNYDVKFSFDLLNQLGGHILNQPIDFSNIESVKIIGDLETVFTLKQKDNFFDKKLSDIPILSRDYYENLAQMGYDYFRIRHPLGYGPFLIEGYNLQSVVLNSHPSYAFGRPFLNKIVYKFYETEQEMVDDFIQEQVDLIELKENNTAQRLHQILKDKVKIFSTPRPEKKVYFILFNVNREPFNRTKIRLAIRSSINQTEIIKDVTAVNTHLAYSVVDYTHPQFYRELIRENYAPNTALKNLRLEGWQINSPAGVLEKNGENLQFELLFEENSHLEESIARTVKIQLAELGINVLPIPVNFFEKDRLVEQNRYTAVLRSYSYFDDGLFTVLKDFYYRILKNSNFSVNYSNSILERLFAQAENDQNARKILIQRFQIILHQEAPALFLHFDDKIIYAINNRFQNIRVSYSNDEKVYYYRLMPFENWFVPKNLQKFPLY